jgi:hypothetical protein
MATLEEFATKFFGLAPRHCLREPSLLKKYALLFDHIGLYGLEAELVEEAERLKQQGIVNPEFPAWAAELQWLAKNHIVCRTDLLKRAASPDGPIKIGFNYDDRSTARTEALLAVVEGFPEKDADYELRFFAALLHGLDVVPILSKALPLRIDAASVGAKPIMENVVRITLNAMPQPDDLTSWESIIEFREDAGSMQRLRGLRRWLSDMAKKPMSPREIVQELEYLLGEHEEHMRLHGMKANKGALETVVTVGAELAEDLVKFKWGKAAKLAFVLKHRKIQLLEAEAQAPGREVAYILRTRREFGSNRT